MQNANKWPTFFQVVKVVDGVISKVLTIFLIVGVVNEKQAKEASKVFDLHAKIEIETDRFVIASLVNEEKLKEIVKVFNPRAKEWRGQYQALSKEIVKACKDVLP